MAAETRNLKQLPPKSRHRNPLNVVVEKVGATRAMVHGDVSAESLKELLISSLSLLPTTKVTNDWNTVDEGSKKSGASDRKTGPEDLDEEEGSNAASRNIDKQKRAIVSRVSSGVLEYDKKGQKIKGMKVGSIHDGDDIQDSEREFSGLLKNDDKTRSGNKTKITSPSKFRGSLNSTGVNGEGAVEEIGGLKGEEATESSQSCFSVLSTDKSSLSHDGRWLQKYFGNPLVWGLREVGKNKPLDPVCYLAFWLRKYRSDEEMKKRRMDFDNELQTKRLLLRSQGMAQEKSTENLELEYYGEDEGEGGRADWNFQNYSPSSDRSAEEVTPEDIQLN